MSNKSTLSATASAFPNKEVDMMLRKVTGPSYREGGGPAYEKAKMVLRRPTPDSEAIASSDDDHEGPLAHRQNTANSLLVRRPSTSSGGWLQDFPSMRKFSLPSGALTGSQPTTPASEHPQQPQQARASTAATGFAWNTNSFGASQGSARSKEFVPSPTSAQPPALPSPTDDDEADDGIGFLLNQSNPTRKFQRSQSYSVGQADIENSPIAQFSNRRGSALRPRSSKPSLLGDSLSQLREDDIDDVESSNGSEHGVRLPSGYYEREVLKHIAKQDTHLPKQELINMKQPALARHSRVATGSPLSQQRQKTPIKFHHTDFAIEEVEDSETLPNPPKLPIGRRFSEHVGVMSSGSDAGQLGDNAKKPQWSSLAGFNDPLAARRHSVHQVPNNYGGGGFGNSYQPPSNLHNPLEIDEDRDEAGSPAPMPFEEFDTTAYFKGHGVASRVLNAAAITAAHPDPAIPRSANPISSNPYQVPSVLGRPGRRLYVVAFKCNRAAIYYVYDNTGLEIRNGDLVIVEGDRGCDLGQVTHSDISLEDAKIAAAEANDQHFRWLVMFSQYSLSGAASDHNMLGALARANGFPNMNRATLTSMVAQQEVDAKPRMIKRVAQHHEVLQLREKEGMEAKAKRLGAIKAAEHKLPMEILDAEYQADMHKLTYYYYAEAYVNFNELVTDLFKQYKVRIWMSAVNPASVVNPAGLTQVPPPSAIGPGAILPSRTPASTLPIGPGFGPSSYRPTEQSTRVPFSAAQTNYEEASYYPFAHQLAGYPAQGSYGMANPYANSQQEMYGRYPQYNPMGGYPQGTASGSPMNYGAYYPPTTYSSSPAFQGAAATPAWRALASSAGYQPRYSSAGTSSGGYGNGYTAASTSAYDPSLLAAMHNLSFLNQGN
ncbi:hypothetical protein P154DRAFT_153803 [Amniculicola lignicola CBS 123094]|uniref:PSP1 C-terminal domain-containing protein n=1 Tax=Amniculicola lignicola CBS 123094 TaxID=1392246 RepID=A0A6A5WNT4_9PLEO|nr:hypothetical protein P154DRAFT_153803 [Amniculicola lignicola CBS 123094]